MSDDSWRIKLANKLIAENNTIQIQELIESLPDNNKLKTHCFEFKSGGGIVQSVKTKSFFCSNCYIDIHQSIFNTEASKFMHRAMGDTLPAYNIDCKEIQRRKAETLEVNGHMYERTHYNGNITEFKCGKCDYKISVKNSGHYQSDINKIYSTDEQLCKGEPSCEELLMDDALQ